MEWARLPFQVDRSAIPEVDPEDEWSVDDAGRKSSVSVIGSSIYDVGKQKMIAVRLLQSGRELRNGNIVPYVGFFQGPDGSIWPARTTEEEGRLCQGCLAMSTLWFTLPEVKSFATTDYKLWFGEKLDDQAFAHVRQYNVPPTGTTPVLESVPSIEGVRGYSLYTDTKIGPVDLYPYQVAFNRIYITVADNSNKYQIEFDYSMGKMSDVAAGGKNRGLKMVLKDNREKVMKSWNFPLEGNGALAEGTNKLTVDLTGMDLSHMVPPRLYVYETFEGGERLIGSNVRLVTGSVIYDDAEAEDSGE